MEMTGYMLLRRLLLVYGIVLLGGLIILQADTMLVAPSASAGLRIPQLGNLAFALVMALVIAGYSAWRMRPVLKELDQQNGKDCTGLTSGALLRLYRMPYELLISSAVIGVLYSIVYHAETAPNNDTWLQLLGQVAGEQSLFISLAIVLFTTTRRLFRPVMRLQQLPDQFDGRTSIAQPIVLTYACTMLVTLLSLLQLTFTTAKTGATIDPYKLGLIASFYFIMSIALFSYVTMQFRQELRGLIRGIRGLVAGQGLPSGALPAILHDEAGELAVAYNELQIRINREYESLERELKMAYNVQQKLLPPGDLTIGAYRITARCQSYREVGGDFFDVVSLSPNRFAVMIGDVSGKGLPAALIMSAQLLIFRSEIRRNGSPSEVLARMNRQLCEAMGEEGSVSIGVGVIDLTTNEVQYASAGHLSPYIIAQDGRVQAVECSSLPIGIDPDATYEEICFEFNNRDRFLLYTDGLIEAVNQAGQMYSFDGLEAELASWQPEEDLTQTVDNWLARMDHECGAGMDDRTVVVLELAGEYRSSLASAATFDNPFMTREWAMRSKLGDEKLIALKLGDWMKERWPNTDIYEDVQSAVCEAMINAIEHGNKMQPNAYVNVIAQIGGMLMVCRIYDEGGGFYPKLSRDEDEMRKKLESEDPRGWGLVMIDTLADYWTTGRDERGFYTELYFMRKSHSVSEAEAEAEAEAGAEQAAQKGV
ncbi:serine phosphatase RsbU (regulator of sigma subunit) [Paenibacillus taihuensis]|uniref:Serine phosphatase RsbU (Regulator of sigma subunit) n=1 Tax=Paenibacillus taihuensis TaxID=1156355 RepID=A0A3D9S7M8_9BACL|nr:ATP-binding SpoIIE family protein phosphatase [Paenibacillus taihuensis]REE84542.1 serine phosphatase RsbU (regulator of sigma subunit) [Paenibacillus taihuensis]